jgi:hypothetical protein
MLNSFACKPHDVCNIAEIIIIIYHNRIYHSRKKGKGKKKGKVEYVLHMAFKKKTNRSLYH